MSNTKLRKAARAVVKAYTEGLLDCYIGSKGDGTDLLTGNKPKKAKR